MKEKSQAVIAANNAEHAAWPCIDDRFLVGTDRSCSPGLPLAPKDWALLDRKEHIVKLSKARHDEVSNRKALEWAHQCCGKIFPETKDTEWEVKTTDGPATLIEAPA